MIKAIQVDFQWVKPPLCVVKPSSRLYCSAVPNFGQKSSPGLDTHR